MNKKEVSEIKKLFTPAGCAITRICGCYVDAEKEKRTELKEAFLSLPEEEAFKYFTIFRGAMSGTLGKNLINMEFPLHTEAEGGTQEFLLRLRDSELKDDVLLEEFYDKVIDNYDYGENYYIILIHCAYDIPAKSTDGNEMFDASDYVYSFIQCSVCPVKPTKPALGYYVAENEFRTRTADWLVAPPELGFLFPAFDDRSANLYNALYYTRNTAENHPEFVEAVFQTQAPMAADTQKETFQALLADSLGEECDYDVVQAVHDQLCDLVDEHKHSREDEPLTLSKEVFKGMLECCGVTQERVEQFDRTFDDQFGADAGLNPQNLLQRQMDIRMPDVTIRISPERSDLVETRVVDGTRYLMIRVDEGVEVNGVNISIT